MLDDEIRYKLLKILHADPAISQRTLAKELDISLGKVNFCVKALLQKGLIKARNFKNNSNKRGYMYVLTPRGIEEKAKVTSRFLRRKMDEYEALEAEIEQLRREVAGMVND